MAACKFVLARTQFNYCLFQIDCVINVIYCIFLIANKGMCLHFIYCKQNLYKITFVLSSCGSALALYNHTIFIGSSRSVSVCFRFTYMIQFIYIL